MLLYGDLTYKIRGAIFKVYNYWGPGLFEQIYEESLVCQLRKEGLKVEQQIPLPVIYDGQKLPCDYRLDLLVEDKVIIELKSVRSVCHKNNTQCVYPLQLCTQNAEAIAVKTVMTN